MIHTETNTCISEQMGVKKMSLKFRFKSGKHIRMHSAMLCFRLYARVHVARQEREETIKAATPEAAVR